jgi:hypothetical protein
LLIWLPAFHAYEYFEFVSDFLGNQGGPINVETDDIFAANK